MRLSREKLLWILLLVISFCLLIGSKEQRLHKASLLGRTVYYPFLTSFNEIEELFTMRQRNQILADKLAQKLLLTNQLENELHTVKRALQIQEDILWETERPYSYRIASVIAYRGSFTNRILIIDKGSRHNIEVDFPVISENGAVGKILTVFPNHSLVLPLTNPLFKLGVIAERNGIQGLLEADNYGNIFMNMLLSGSQINIGDRIVTSTVSTIFPRGYPIGTVQRLIKNPEDVYMKAQIAPFAEVSNLEQVIVLFYKKELPDE